MHTAVPGEVSNITLATPVAWSTESKVYQISWMVSFNYYAYFIIISSYITLLQASSNKVCSQPSDEYYNVTVRYFGYYNTEIIYSNEYSISLNATGSTIDVVIIAGNLVGMGSPKLIQFTTISCASKKTMQVQNAMYVVNFFSFFAGLSTTANFIYTFFITCIYFLLLY